MPEPSPLHDLYVDQLKDLYDAEQQAARFFSDVAHQTSHPALHQVLVEHFEQSRNHSARLERILTGLNLDPAGRPCAGMEGILHEARELVDRQVDPAARDAAAIAAAQRVEHYEIAGYGTARAYAAELGYEGAADILSETLEEEEDCDLGLTQLATGGLRGQGINLEARGA